MLDILDWYNIQMELNKIYEQIIKVDGNCLKHEPACGKCPFMNKCLSKMINTGKHIPANVRVKWALDKIIEGVIFEEKI